MGQERYFFICNPAANSGRMLKNWPSIQTTIEQYLSEDEYEVVFTTHREHATQIAEDAANSGDYSHLIAVGGDGVANETINGVMRADQQVTVGMIPAGTSNDGPQTLGFPNDAEETVEMLFKNETKQLGVGKISGDFGSEPHYFYDHCDTGLAAMAARSARDSWLRGEWKYTWYALKNLSRFKSNVGTVTVGDEVYEGKFAVVAAGFGEYMSGYKLWPDNTNDSGDFGVLIGLDQTRLSLLKLMLAAEKGNHLDRSGVFYVRGTTIEIDLEVPWPYQAEGEIFTDASRTTKMEYIPDAIKFVVGSE